MSDTTRGPTGGRQTDREWRDRAACRGVDPELFFPIAEPDPVYEEQVAAAKWVCARCPVREPCLAEALARIPNGIAGGLTEHERRQLQRDRHTTPASSCSGGSTAKPLRRYGDGQEIRSVGLCDGWTRAQRADLGKALLAAGLRVEQVARTCGVSTRTVERWAADTPSVGSKARATREGSHGGNRTRLQISTAHDTQAQT